MPNKKYADLDFYIRKLELVMNRFGIEKYNWNCDRHGAFIEFWLEGEFYRFDHSVENARQHEQDINFGSDCFAQLVLALEDLVRISSRGIYKLQRWITGMKALPAPCKGGVLPQCFVRLGLSGIPKNADEIKGAYRKLAATCHPDKGGSAEDFALLGRARDEALEWIKP